MSDKSKVRRARRDERQAKQGEKVFYWIIGVLFALAVATLISYAI